MKPICLEAADAHALIALLGEYQTYLEELIGSILIEGETEPRDPRDAFMISRDRRCWRRAESLVRKLDAALHTSRKGTAKHAGGL